MAGKTLGDYVGTPLPKVVDDVLNYRAQGKLYMVLDNWDDDPQLGDVTFPVTLGAAHSDADWAGTYGKRSIVVDLADMLRLPWDRLPVVYDNENDG